LRRERPLAASQQLRATHHATQRAWCKESAKDLVVSTRHLVHSSQGVSKVRGDLLMRARQVRQLSLHLSRRCRLLSRVDFATRHHSQRLCAAQRHRYPLIALLRLVKAQLLLSGASANGATRSRPTHSPSGGQRTDGISARCRDTLQRQREKRCGAQPSCALATAHTQVALAVEPTRLMRHCPDRARIFCHSGLLLLLLLGGLFGAAMCTRGLSLVACRARRAARSAPHREAVEWVGTRSG
jgi:hypothetical protein